MRPMSRACRLCGCRGPRKAKGVVVYEAAGRDLPMTAGLWRECQAGAREARRPGARPRVPLRPADYPHRQHARRRQTDGIEGLDSPRPRNPARDLGSTGGRRLAGPTHHQPRREANGDDLWDSFYCSHSMRRWSWSWPSSSGRAGPEKRASRDRSRNWKADIGKAYRGTAPRPPVPTAPWERCRGGARWVATWVKR